MPFADGASREVQRQTAWEAKASATERVCLLESIRAAVPERKDDPEIVEQLVRRGAGDRSPDDWANLLGRCVWDVFSDNNEVFTTEGAVVHLGTFRASAGFIADFRSRQRSDDSRTGAWDYLDFYMGTYGLPDEVDSDPAYDIIFTRMRSVELDWRYVHPHSYDPSEAVARQLDRQRRAEELAALRAAFDEVYRQSVEAARAEPPPATVQSYQRVYGRTPAGWPPS